MFRLLVIMLFAMAATCRAPQGAHVVLFGGVDDPDVLVWDSRDRLTTYSEGNSDERRFLLPHALLNRPGTKAIVVTCFGGSVHPKFSLDAADAIGIFIVSGKYKGRYGWVSSVDVHGRAIRESSSTW